jgi:guanylate kinase
MNGREYHFVTPERFRELIDQQEFLEWEEVYPGQYYGTLRSEVVRIWEKGEHAVFDIDVIGGLNLKKEFGKQACAIFVSPPNLEELENRLRSRNTDDEDSLQKRLGKAEYEMTFAKDFDHILVNDTLEQTLQEAERLVKDFIEI